MDILENVGHRAWPLPKDPWILFTHWPVARDRLRELVPSHLEIDIFENEAWVSVSPFRLTNLSPRGIPALPVISSFDEINVRTYVVYNGIPGIYFFSLDANSAMAVITLPTFASRTTADRSRFAAAAGAQNRSNSRRATRRQGGC